VEFVRWLPGFLVFWCAIGGAVTAAPAMASKLLPSVVDHGVSFFHSFEDELCVFSGEYFPSAMYVSRVFWFLRFRSGNGEGGIVSSGDELVRFDLLSVVTLLRVFFASSPIPAPTRAAAMAAFPSTPVTG